MPNKKNSDTILKEFSEDENDEEIEVDFIDNMLNDSDSNCELDLNLSNKIIRKIKLNNEKVLNCPEDCKQNYKEMLKLEEECCNLENKCLLLDYVKSEQINESLEKIEKMNNDLNLMIDTIKYYEGDNSDSLNFEELNVVEKKLLKLHLNISIKLSKVIYILLFY